jgi:hypothetical protein
MILSWSDVLVGLGLKITNRVYPDLADWEERMSRRKGGYREKVKGWRSGGTLRYSSEGL